VVSLAFLDPMMAQVKLDLTLCGQQVGKKFSSQEGKGFSMLAESLSNVFCSKSLCNKGIS
jgi:hypothetical protein